LRLSAHVDHLHVNALIHVDLRDKMLPVLPTWQAQPAANVLRICSSRSQPMTRRPSPLPTHPVQDVIFLSALGFTVRFHSMTSGVILQ
jgi:hypothetical protein